MTNRADIQAVYAFYQKLFTGQPSEFYWAGLAKLAGAPVYAGLSDAEYAKAMGIFPVDNVNAVQQALIQMNIAILNDIAWQFEAYKSGGLNALQNIYALDVNQTSLDLNAITGWQNIDQGIQNGDPNLIKEGNERLLQREQQQVLAFGYAQLSAMPFVTQGMSFFAKNPVPGGPTFASMEPSGNIANYSDRWDWITHASTGMWWLWVGTPLDEQLGWVEIPLLTNAANYARYTPVY